VFGNFQIKKKILKKGKVSKANVNKIFGEFKQECMDNVDTCNTKRDTGNNVANPYMMSVL
jgi:hypothetical protein